MIKLLYDPALFNYIMFAFSVCAAVRWSVYGFETGLWGDAGYWASAAAITAAVTWGKFHA